MIPRPARGLADLAGKLATAIAPETSSRFAMANTGMISALLTALAQEAERGVASRMDDITDMKALLRAAGAGIDPPARDAFVNEQPASLRLGDVEALHARGLALIIELHAWAEDQDRALDRELWAFLRRHTERHRIDLPAG